MSNTIPTDAPIEGSGFTREAPESNTLLSLAMHHSVKVFELEHIKSGHKMSMAHFDYDGWHYLYQGGDGAHTHHLFFFVCAWEDDRAPENVALDFFKRQFILTR